MDKTKEIINEFLVDIFNEILYIEEKALVQMNLQDLTISEIHTLEAINGLRPKTMTEVARDLRITTSTLTTSVNRLVRKGYVNRKRDDTDKRIVLVTLSEKGERANDLHSEFHKDMVGNIMDRLSKDEADVLYKSLQDLKSFFKKKHKSFLE